MRAPWVLMITVLFASCGDGTEHNRSASTCISSCEQVHAECGVVNDLCGGVLECNYCPLGMVCGGDGKPNTCQSEPCVPRSCEANECGMVSDGCADVMECPACKAGYSCQDSECQCKTDASEGNNEVTSIGDVRVAVDSSNTRETLQNLTLGGTDVVDWYQFEVRDENLPRNPLVRFKPRATDHADVTFEVKIYYNCDFYGENHSCNEGTSLTSDKRGCERVLKTSDEAWVELKADCTGPIDGGKVSVEIRQECGPKGCVDDCHLYALDYEITEYPALWERVSLPAIPGFSKPAK